MFSWGFVTGVLHSVVLAALAVSQGLHAPGRNQYETRVSAAQSRPMSAKWIDEGSSSLQVSVCCRGVGTTARVEAGRTGRMMGSREQGRLCWRCAAGLRCQVLLWLDAYH